MKRALLAAALLAGFAASASAATTTWQGDLFIIAVNNATACKAVNMNVGDFARFTYRPKSVAGNGTADLLAWHFSRSSGQLKITTGAVAGQLHGATAANINYIYGSAGFGQFSGNVIAATASPATPVVGTASVAITITINNLYSSPAPAAVSGCNATFKGVLGKKLS